MDKLDKSKVVSHRLFRESCANHAGSYVKVRACACGDVFLFVCPLFPPSPVVARCSSLSPSLPPSLPSQLFLLVLLMWRVVVFQDLSCIGRELSRTLIIDNSPASYIFHPDNAVPISSWFDDPTDTALTELTPILIELAKSEDLVAALRSGRSEVLVLTGEAGIGKSALLQHLWKSAADCTVLTAAGVESEMELAFAGLQQLCAPVLEYRVGLPHPQREALEAAFGLDVGGTAPTRFLVGLAVLGLLAAAAQERPVLPVSQVLRRR